jgi:hypothetical protein
VVMMRSCNRAFPGAASEVSDQFASDVASDEKAIVDAIAAVRGEASSIEAIGYLLGTDPAQISRHLRGVSSTTLTNYIRIARALGYRSKIILERAETDVLADLSIGSHKVHRTASRRSRI